MVSTTERLFLVPSKTGSTAYHWNSRTLQRLGSVTGPISHHAIDLERDRIVTGHLRQITVWRGALAGELQIEHTFSTAPVSDFDVGSLVMKDGVLIASQSSSSQLIAIDLQRAERGWSLLQPAPSSTQSNGSLLIDREQLLYFEQQNRTQQWRVYHCDEPRSLTTVKPHTQPLLNGFGFDNCRPAIAQSSRVWAALCNEYGGHSHFVTLTMFDALTRDRLYSIECPMLYTRELSADPDPFYVHVDGCEEQLVVCESNRGIGLFRAETLQALSRQASTTARLVPDVLHRVARWISVPNRVIEAAYLCGSAQLAGVWRDEQTRERHVIMHDLSQ